MSTTKAIEVKNVSFGYFTKEPILKSVSFHVEKGAFLGIIGPNGSGKSTLLKLLLGLLTPWEGEILIDGRAVSSKNSPSYVPQTLFYDRKFPISAREVVLGGRTQRVSFSGRYSKEDLEIADEALATVGLSSFSKQLFGTLSTGQAQRVLIARALAKEATLLLLDEPTSSADPLSENTLLETIEKLQGKMTILMVTHNLRALLTHVQGVLCVQGGACMLQPKEVCEHFALGLYHVPLIETKEGHFFSQHGAKE